MFEIIAVKNASNLSKSSMNFQLIFFLSIRFLFFSHLNNYIIGSSFI